MARYRRSVKFFLQNTCDEEKVTKKEYSFYLNKPTQLRCFIRYNSKVVPIGTGLNIKPVDWNTEKNEPRQKATLLNSDKLKDDLSDIKKWVENAFDYLTDKYNAYPEKAELLALCKDVIKNKGDIPCLKQVDKYTLFSYIERLIADTRSGKRTKKDGTKYAPDTPRPYDSAYSVIKKFAAHINKSTFQFEDITLEWYYDFREYCYQDEKLSDNYFGAVIKFLKTCMNESKEEKLHNVDAHLNKRFIKVQVDVDNVYLDEKQLEQLAKLDLSKNKKLERVRDLFLVGCWTGLRFSDFTNIKPKNIKGDFIEIKTQKTGEVVAIPIHATVKEIMSRYRGLTDNSLPPAISNVKLNEYIKDVAAETGFDELVSLEKARAGSKVIVTMPLSDLVTTHTARRAFASNMFKMGVPTIVIMAVTGHTTEKAFLKYIKVTPKEKAMIMLEVWNRQAMKVVSA